MPVNESIVRRLGISRWPVALRHPAIKALLKRKHLCSFPFRVRIGDLLYDGDAANLIDYHVLTRGGFEPGLDQLLADWSRYIDGGDKVFVDVGANSGLHTIQASQHFCQVHAFEPYPPMFERLQHSISINALHNVVAHQVALSNEVGEVCFRVPEPGNTGTGTIVDDQHEVGQEGIISVQAAKGDGYLDGSVADVGAIKIDVEGAETRVLEGLRRRISEDCPLLIFEVLQGGAAVMAAFAERLPDDYVMFRLLSAKRRRYAVVPWKGEACDVVAVPKKHRCFIDTSICEI